MRINDAPRSRQFRFRRSSSETALSVRSVVIRLSIDEELIEDFFRRGRAHSSPAPGALNVSVSVGLVSPGLRRSAQAALLLRRVQLTKYARIVAHIADPRINSASVHARKSTASFERSNAMSSLAFSSSPPAYSSPSVGDTIERCGRTAACTRR